LPVCTFFASFDSLAIYKPLIITLAGLKLIALNVVSSWPSPFTPSRGGQSRRASFTGDAIHHAHLSVPPIFGGMTEGLCGKSIKQSAVGYLIELKDFAESPATAGLIA